MVLQEDLVIPEDVEVPLVEGEGLEQVMLIANGVLYAVAVGVYDVDLLGEHHY